MHSGDLFKNQKQIGNFQVFFDFHIVAFSIDDRTISKSDSGLFGVKTETNQVSYVNRTIIAT